MDKTGADHHKGNSFNAAKECILIIMVMLVVLPFMRNVERNPFHGDETYWLRSSIQYKLLFMDRALDSKEFRSCRNEPVGKYIIGLVLSASGYGNRMEELSKMELWNFWKDYSWNVANQRMPPPELLSVVRFAMALLGSITCVLVYWIGRTAFNIKTGIIASLLLAYNPLMLLCCKRAMVDAPLLLFMTANIILIIYFYRSLGKQRPLKTLMLAALMGANCALAAGTKLNGGLALFIVALFCIFLIVMKSGFYVYAKKNFFVRTIQLCKDREVKSIVAGLLIACITTLAVLIGMTPCLYHQPVNGIKQMVDVRTEHVQIQRTNKWGTNLDSLTKKFRYVVRNTLLPKHFVLLGNILKIPIDFGLFFLGLIVLLYSEYGYIHSNSKPSFQSIIILWTVVTFTGITVWIPLNWDRYYLPIVPCIVMVEAYCIARIYDMCAMFIKSRFTSATVAL